MASASKKSRTLRSIKDSTFLDDPSAYPEFAELTSKLPALHTFRLGFHKNRTASLLLIIAVSMALSGVSRPPASAAIAAWLEYLRSATYIERLTEHFEGILSGLAIMTVIAVVSILAYPVSMVVNNGEAQVAVAPVSSLGTCAVSFGIISVVVWSIAVWSMRRFAWGLASGLWVGLFAACTTLKITSFAAAATSAPGKYAYEGVAASRTWRVGATCPLTFKEYLFFLFLSPSLVCDVRLMQASARRSSRPLRAASEFFHAILAFLAVHCVAGSVMAPAMRMLVMGVKPEWFDHAVPGWAELDVAGGGGWPSWEATTNLLEGDKGPWVTAVCFLLLMMPLSSGAYFLVFYAFWHCVCLGLAELWGFPDRNLYGCWWLMLDDPRKMLRMWSAPVHRWLSACVHQPMLHATATATSRSRCLVSNGSGKRVSPDTDGKSSSTNQIGAGASSTGWVCSVLATFLVSIIVHEAVVFVAFRGTCIPFNTFLLIVAATLVVFWDVFFPKRGKDRRHERSPAAMASTAVIVTAECNGASCAAGNSTPIAPTNVKSGSNSENMGSRVGTALGSVKKEHDGRGLAAIFVLNVLVQMSVLISECAGWLLWRYVFMK